MRQCFRGWKTVEVGPKMTYIVQHKVNDSAYP